MSSKTSFQATARLSLIAAAVLATTAGVANAQSNVTLYGRVDAGVQFTDKSARADDSLTELANGGIRPSIWGLKGTEDLGGGLKAVFNLEAHFSTDTGASTGPGAGRLGSGGFRRQANVGISSDMGTVLLGRQYSPAILANLGTEPRAFKEQFSGLYPYAFMQNPGTNTPNDLGIFLGNAVSYSNNFGPVYVGAAVAAGEGTGRTYTIAGSYTGPVTVSASYQEIQQAPDRDGSKHTMVGVAVPFGPITIKGSYQNGELYNVAGTKTNKIDFYGVGVDFAWNPTNTLNGTFYQGKNKITGGASPEATTFIVSNDYAISKRTTIYVQAAFVDSDPGANDIISPVLVNGGLRGDAKTTVFGAGISHNF